MTDREAWIEQQLAIMAGLLFQARPWVSQKLKDQIDTALASRPSRMAKNYPPAGSETGG